MCLEELDHEDPAGPVSPEAVFSLRHYGSCLGVWPIVFAAVSTWSEQCSPPFDRTWPSYGWKTWTRQRRNSCHSVRESILLRQMLQWREWVLEHEQPTILRSG